MKNAMQVSLTKKIFRIIFAYGSFARKKFSIALWMGVSIATSALLVYILSVALVITALFEHCNSGHMRNWIGTGFPVTHSVFLLALLIHATVASITFYKELDGEKVENDQVTLAVKALLMKIQVMPMEFKEPQNA